MTVTACICVSIWASLYHISSLGLTYIEYCKSMIFHVFTFTFPLCPSVCVGRAGVVVTFPKTGLHVCCFLLILQSAIMVFVFVFVIKFVFVFVFVFEAPSFPHNLRAAWAWGGGEDTEQRGVRRQGGGVEVPVERWWYLVMIVVVGWRFQYKNGENYFFRLLNAPPTESLLLRTFWALSCRWMEDCPPPEREVQLLNL